MSDELVEIHLLGVPVRVHRRSAEHTDELQREFALLRASAAAGSDVPTRLLALIDELTSRYEGFTAGTRRELLDAMERGVESVDLVYRIPSHVRGATIHLGDLLDEADRFCIEGDLLTLAAPTDVLAYRRWFLREFVRQIDGEAPTRWSDFTP
ncbi:MAG: hypothetical protein ACRDJP_06715 [Actinomycetota bacterium]